MKYTSCEKCKNGIINIFNRKTKSYEQHYCSCYKEYINKKRDFVKLLDTGLIENEFGYNYLSSIDLNNYQGNEQNKKRLCQYIHDFDTKFYDKHLFIYGPNGTQKTTSVKAIAYYLHKLNKKVYYINSKEFFDMFSDFENHEHEIKKFMESDLLIMDEFCIKKLALFKSSDWKESSCIAPLKQRLEVVRKATIFISNDTIDDIKNSKLGDLFGDLIDRETIKLKFDDKYIRNINSIWDD